MTETMIIKVFPDLNQEKLMITVWHRVSAYKVNFFTKSVARAVR